MVAPINCAQSLGQGTSNRHLRQYSSETSAQTSSSQSCSRGYEALEVSTSASGRVHADTQQAGLLIRKTTNLTLQHVCRGLETQESSSGDGVPPQSSQAAMHREVLRSEHLLQFWAQRFALRAMGCDMWLSKATPELIVSLDGST